MYDFDKDKKVVHAACSVNCPYRYSDEEECICTAGLY